MYPQYNDNMIIKTKKKGGFGSITRGSVEAFWGVGAGRGGGTRNMESFILSGRLLCKRG
jgi:hypothetical protein